MSCIRKKETQGLGLGWGAEEKEGCRGGGRKGAGGGGNTKKNVSSAFFSHARSNVLISSFFTSFLEILEVDIFDFSKRLY